MHEDRFENSVVYLLNIILYSLTRNGVIPKVSGLVFSPYEDLSDFPYVWFQESGYLTVFYKCDNGSTNNLFNQELVDAAIDISERIFNLRLLRHANMSAEAFSAYKWLSCALLTTKHIPLKKLEDKYFLRGWIQHPTFWSTPKEVKLEEIEKAIFTMI